MTHPFCGLAERVAPAFACLFLFSSSRLHRPAPTVVENQQHISLRAKRYTERDRSMAQDHCDLPGMVNRVLHDSMEHRFVGIAAPRNLFRQILDGKIPHLLFEQVAALVPAA